MTNIDPIFLRESVESPKKPRITPEKSEQYSSKILLIK
jgi:hypothetical protein